MDGHPKDKTLEIMEMQAMSKKITQKEIEEFLTESNNSYKHRKY